MVREKAGAASHTADPWSAHFRPPTKRHGPPGHPWPSSPMSHVPVRGAPWMMMTIPLRFWAARPSAEMSRPRWRAMALQTGLSSSSPAASLLLVLCQCSAGQDRVQESVYCTPPVLGFFPVPSGPRRGGCVKQRRAWGLLVLFPKACSGWGSPSALLMVPGHTMVSGVAERGLRGPGQVSFHEQLQSPRAF